MNNAEMQKAIETVVEQQAQFAVDIQKLNETVAALTAVTYAGLTQLNEKVNIILDAQIKTEERLAGLVESHTKLVESHTRLAESQARTDERLNALINVVERYFSRNNGHT